MREQLNKAFDGAAEAKLPGILCRSIHLPTLIPNKQCPAALPVCAVSAVCYIEKDKMAGTTMVGCLAKKNSNGSIQCPSFQECAEDKNVTPTEYIDSSGEPYYRQDKQKSSSATGAR